MSTAAERAADALQRRKCEDFRFFLVAHSKGNPGIYDLLRDRTLDTPLIVHPPQGPASAYENP